jgi:transposase
LILPPDLRDWVPAVHLVDFGMDAMDLVEVSAVACNVHGTGSTPYPPRLLLGLLVYSYATRVFSSRQIERTSHEKVAVRLLCADTHPDHNPPCTFRSKNSALLHRALARVLELATGRGVLKLGGVGDGHQRHEGAGQRQQALGNELWPSGADPAKRGRGDFAAFG